MLLSHLEAFVEEHYLEGCVLQQDNAPSHSAKYTRDYFMECGITVMEWLARFSDLNCIKNVWGEFTRRLNDGACSFDSVEDLCEALYYELDKIGFGSTVSYQVNDESSRPVPQVPERCDRLLDIVLQLE